MAADAATEVVLSDAVSMTGTRRRTSAGFMVADCRFARGDNIQVYSGREAGKPDRQYMRIYRPETVVFDADTMARWAFKPVTVGHPRTGAVTAENWKDEAVGFAGEKVVRDGEFVTVGIGLMDARAIAEVEAGTTELSAGYRVALDYEPGIAPNGEPYDAKIAKIAPDHIAIVPKGRAGSECRFGDTGADKAPDVPEPPSPKPSPQETRPMADENTGRAVILVDGFTVATTPQGVEAIQKLQTQLKDAQTQTSTNAAAHQTLVDSLNGQLAAARQTFADEMAKKDGEIAGLKLTHQTALDAVNAKLAELEAATSPTALEARAAARAATVAVARRVLGDAFTGSGLSDAEIRKATVIKAMGPTLTDADTKPEVFFDSVFEAVAVSAAAQQQQPAKPDPLRTAIANGGGALALDAAQQAKREPTAWEKNVARLQSGWVNAGQGGA